MADIEVPAVCASEDHDNRRRQGIARLAVYQWYDWLHGAERARQGRQVVDLVTALSLNAYSGGLQMYEFLV